MTALSSGDRLGPYEISAKLGEGGMGEVYRATDSRLKREVAIKVLPAAFVEDKERLARFEREAQLLAQLNHTNIAQIYGLETSGATHALVMELVPGPTLAERLESGPLSLTESLSFALQIAQALEEAHEKGIVHRDLKPQNIKASSEGKVKVLDFGLAKAMDAGASAASAVDLARSPTLMNSPTLTAVRGTQLGMILGTAAYMAPEQARGAAVDKRADIWAFGVVFFEMLTGQRLFEGETVSDTLAAVLRQEIDWKLLPATTPQAIRSLLRRCLERNAKNRLHDIADARIVIDEVLSGRNEEFLLPGATLSTARSPARRALPWTIAAGALALAATALFLRPEGRDAADSAARPTSVLTVRLPAELSLPLDNRGLYGQTGLIAISRNGRRIAFVAGPGDEPTLYLRDLDSSKVVPFDGTAGASSPFFSPDGRWIGYFSPGKLRKVAVEGGRPIDLADASLDRGGAWCPDGSIVFPSGVSSGLFRLPPGGGPPVELTTLDTAHGERTHRWPAVLPGGKEVAFTVGRVGLPGDYESATIDAVDLATGRRRALFRGASMVRFTPDGHALLAREGQVLALPLAGANGAGTDDAVQVVANVAGVAASGVLYFDVAEDGTLVYAESDPGANRLDLAWLTRSGALESLGLPPREYQGPKISPDGQRIAVTIGPSGGRAGDVWIHERASGALTKLSFEGRSWTPIWSLDGRNITYSTITAAGGDEFRTRPAAGGAEPRTIRAFGEGRARQPVAWMPDGSLLAWEDAGNPAVGNVVYFPPGAGDQIPIASTAAIEIQAAASPDGRFVAYSYDANGNGEIYVQPFPPTGSKWQVATGGFMPIWSRDGREIYYLQGDSLMAVPVTTAGAFAVGAPHRLFDMPPTVLASTDTTTNFDVAADGRFLVVRHTSQESMAGHLVVALGWFETLRQLAPLPAAR
jgi:eukaryotic-like serine/threonine-protein kinase